MKKGRTGAIVPRLDPRGFRFANLQITSNQEWVVGCFEQIRTPSSILTSVDSEG